MANQSLLELDMIDEEVSFGRFVRLWLDQPPESDDDARHDANASDSQLQSARTDLSVDPRNEFKEPTFGRFLQLWLQQPTDLELIEPEQSSHATDTSSDEPADELYSGHPPVRDDVKRDKWTLFGDLPDDMTDAEYGVIDCAKYKKETDGSQEDWLSFAPDLHNTVPQTPVHPDSIIPYTPAIVPRTPEHWLMAPQTPRHPNLKSCLNYRHRYAGPTQKVLIRGSITVNLYRSGDLWRQTVSRFSEPLAPCGKKPLSPFTGTREDDFSWTSP